MNQAALNSFQGLHKGTQCVIVLCGIPGSGKSTFAEELLNNMDEETRVRWVCFNQDVLKTRVRVEEETQSALQTGMNVIIDRCNFDNIQREHWILLAHQNEVQCIISITMNDVSLEDCVRRASARDEDGIHRPANWNEVCSFFHRNFQDPSVGEGFTATYDCRSIDDRITVRNEVVAIASRSVNPVK